MRCDRKVNLVWIDADNLEEAMLKSDPVKHYNAWSQLTSASGGKSIVLAFSRHGCMDCLVTRFYTIKTS